MRLVTSVPRYGGCICATCKMLYGSTCCESKTDAGPMFPRTYGEASRLSRWLQVPLDEAMSLQRVSKTEQRALDGIGDSLGRKLIVDGYGFFLPMSKEGSCKYLGRHGCTVPTVKPLICALFPFTKINGTWGVGQWVSTFGFCFAQDALGSQPQELMREFGMTESGLDTLERHWHRDIKMHAAQMRKLLRQRRCC